MFDQNALRIGDGGEIHFLVPFHQQFGVAVQLSQLLVGKIYFILGEYVFGSGQINHLRFLLFAGVPAR